VAGEPDENGGQGSLYAGAEEQRVFGDKGGDIGAGDAEANEEGKDGIGIGGALEVGELHGGFESLRSGEAAGGDEVLLDGEARVWGIEGGIGGEDAVERGGAGGRRMGRGDG
jgi:hypothetical protein